MTEALELLLKLVNNRPDSREYQQAIKDARWLLVKAGYSVNLEG